jgi:LPXTG-motif cell wall-anchored protein
MVPTGDTTSVWPLILLVLAVAAAAAVLMLTRKK